MNLNLSVTQIIYLLPKAKPLNICSGAERSNKKSLKLKSIAPLNCQGHSWFVS